MVDVRSSLYSYEFAVAYVKWCGGSLVHSVSGMFILLGSTERVYSPANSARSMLSVSVGVYCPDTKVVVSQSTRGVHE